MKKFIPLSIPNISGNEIKYVTEALEDGWVSSAGPYVEKFEQKVAQYVHAKGAVSCQNGTSGLHTALMVAGVKKEDIVLVPTLTFIAAVNPVKYIGATPVFMDCDDSLCMSPDKLLAYLEKECYFDGERTVDQATGKVVKALVVVHVFGNMADMERIMDIADKYHIKVIEDATEAIGTYYTDGKYKGKYAGTIGDMGVYSFNGNKIITTGGGGMIVSENKEYLEKAKHLTTQAKSDELYYTHDEVGYNYRMTSLQAALGLAQLEQLETFIAIKNKNYDSYREKLSSIEGLRLLECRENIRCNRWFYALLLESNQWDRDEMISRLQKQGIQTRPVWGLIHEQKPYQKDQAYQIECAKYYASCIVNIPCSTNLQEEEITYVVEILRKMIC